MSIDLFSLLANPVERLELAPGAVLWRHRLEAEAAILLAELPTLLTQAPLRHMQTPGGFSMSVAMSNCGTLGWVTDRKGYRYSPTDPLDGSAWPPMPSSWRQAAVDAAREAGFAGFAPDACLINRYAPGAKMALHQDKDEADLNLPIVSFSFGLPACFLFGGLARGDKAQRILLEHGDVLVWGGPARLRWHGIQPIQPGQHPLTGACRLNLTFRCAASRPEPGP